MAVSGPKKKKKKDLFNYQEMIANLPKPDLSKIKKMIKDLIKKQKGSPHYTAGRLSKKVWHNKKGGKLKKGEKV